MKPKIENRKEMGLVPGSWAWMKHQLENAKITFCVRGDNLPVFTAKLPDVREPFVCFSPARTYNCSVMAYSSKHDYFFHAAPLKSADRQEGVFSYASKAAKDLFIETLKAWAADFAELIE